MKAHHAVSDVSNTTLQVYAWTSDERTNHFVFFVGRGDGNIFDKNIFLASREV
jgi:hypothetical protein